MNVLPPIYIELPFYFILRQDLTELPILASQTWNTHALDFQVTSIIGMNHHALSGGFLG